MNKAKPEKILILGGCRSGKSLFAQQWLDERYARKCYIATLDIKDEPEMAERVALHQKSRGQGWEVIEKPLNPASAISPAPENTDALLLDCLTMWLTNLILAGHSDSEIEARVEQLNKTIPACSLPLVLVANEVGLGIVPESALGRRFRDLAGWTNQQVAKVCDSVYFITAGLPLKLSS